MEIMAVIAKVQPSASRDGIASKKDACGRCMTGMGVASVNWRQKMRAVSEAAFSPALVRRVPEPSLHPHECEKTAGSEREAGKRM